MQSWSSMESTEVDRYNNFASVSLLNGGGSVVGTWHAHGFFVCFLEDGAMWDVKNQYLYLSVSSQKVLRQRRDRR